ncbi:AAA family ATPase, partial [Reyranella sp.]|uniref:AAA family ATPase n=2 Tax=Reyranella sp. TaxID=1929291 RepID=UPI003D11DB8D
MVNQYLISGSEMLAARPGFKLVGRDEALRRLTSILIRSNANSVLLYGPGGVGCSSLVHGLQALKAEPNAPFDIVRKRFFWVDIDCLFSLQDDSQISTEFASILARMARTPDSVLVLADAKVFIEAARNTGNTHFINALVLAIKQGVTQVILEGRDDDLELIFRCHPHVQEAFTIMELAEPDAESLKAMVQFGAGRLTGDHGIRIAGEAVDAAIELTNNYRADNAGMDRAQPERSVSLLDRALASYRLEAHERPPHIAGLQAKAASAKGEEAKALAGEIQRAQQEWEQAQAELRTANRRQREGEEELAKIDWEIGDLGKRESEQRAASPAAAAPQRTSFNLMASKGGFVSPEMQALEGKRAALSKIVEEAKAAFAHNAKAINDRLQLGRDQVLTEFSQITGIPASRLNEDERVKLLRLEDELNESIFDQTAAIAKIANGIKVAKRGRRNRSAPVAFMCLGPSGVGKTETWKQVARLLGLDLLRFDMSEYMEKHAVAKLIGAPPGYEGFDAGGILTNSMRKNPRRVCLFDEIEKGHPGVFDVFMQVLSDGRLTDSLGRTVDFSNAYIGFTTNIGQAHFLDTTLSDEQAEALAVEELKKSYRSEFLNRFAGRQNILCYKRLGVGAIEKIVAREIRSINENYGGQGITVNVTPQDVKAFCQSKYDPTSGARGLPGYLQANLEPIIVNSLLEHPERRGVVNFRYDAGVGDFVADFEL